MSLTLELSGGVAVRLERSVRWLPLTYNIANCNQDKEWKEQPVKLSTLERGDEYDCTVAVVVDGVFGCLIYRAW